MLKKLKARLAELEDLESRGVEDRPEYPGQASRVQQIETLRGEIAAYERLAKIGQETRITNSRNVTPDA
jgi:hypothetical protein